MTAAVATLPPMDTALFETIALTADKLVLDNKYIPLSPAPKQWLFLGVPQREVMFGGSAGPGKSIALLMHAAKWVDHPHYRCLILRRSFSDLSQAGALMDVANQWWGGMKGVRWRAQTKTWVFPSGAQIRFGYLQHEADKYQYAGSEYHCLAVGSAILMGDGTSKAIEQVRPGDYVQTLEGPRRVVASVSTGEKDCVRITTPNGSVVASLTHAILTPDGWRTPDDLLSSRSIERLPARERIVSSTGLSQAGAAHPASRHSDRPLARIPAPPAPGRAASPVVSGCRESDAGIYCEASDDSSSAAPQPQTWSGRLATLVPNPRRGPARYDAHESTYAPRSSELQGSTDRYSTDAPSQSHDDAHARSASAGVRAWLRRQAGAVRHTLAHWRSGDPARTQRHSRCNHETYAHPYTRETRAVSTGDVAYVDAEICRVGVRETWDLQVEDVNHYVSFYSTLLHRNCIIFDELTQFTETQYRFMFSRNRKDIGDPIPLTIRSASNPPLGGNADVGWWVKRELYDKGWPTFVPAALYDNPYIDQEQYRESLMYLDPISRERLLNGNWEIKAAGTMFSTDRIEVVRELPPLRASVRFWDLAATEPTPGNPNPDWTVGARVGLGYDNRVYIMHIARAQKNPGAVERMVKQHAMMDTINVQVWVEQEPGAAGKSMIEHYQQALPTFTVTGARSSGSKVVKATPFANLVDRGNVSMMAGPWNAEFIEELESFPYGEHDDQVDAVSGGVNHLAVAGTVGPVSPDMRAAFAGRLG